MIQATYLDKDSERFQKIYNDGGPGLLGRSGAVRIVCEGDIKLLPFSSTDVKFNITVRPSSPDHEIVVLSRTHLSDTVIVGCVTNSDGEIPYDKPLTFTLWNTSSTVQYLRKGASIAVLVEEKVKL